MKIINIFLNNNGSNVRGWNINSNLFFIEDIWRKYNYISFFYKNTWFHNIFLPMKKKHVLYRYTSFTLSRGWIVRKIPGKSLKTVIGSLSAESWVLALTCGISSVFSHSYFKGYNDGPQLGTGLTAFPRLKEDTVHLWKIKTPILQTFSGNQGHQGNGNGNR